MKKKTVKPTSFSAKQRIANMRQHQKYMKYLKENELRMASLWKVCRSIHISQGG